MSKFNITLKESTSKQSYKNIEVREPLVEDFLEAQKYGDNARMSMALVSQICTFDGKRLTMEEVERLPLSDFLELSAELAQTGFLGSAELLSSLSERGVSL